jgi:hypothetical protein
VVAVAVKQKSLRWSVFGVLWIAVVLFGVGLQLLPNLFTRVLATEGDSLTILGTIAEENGFNRRRQPNELSWLPLSAGDPIYSGDRVYTGDSATVVLSFSDGSKVTLRPKSFVQVRSGRHGLLIDVSQGDVKVEPSAKDITVRSPEQERIEKAAPPKTLAQSPPEEAALETKPTPTAFASPEAARFETYPKNEARVFFSKSQQLLAVAGPRCLSSCIVRVFIDGRTLATQSHKAGEVPDVAIDLTDRPEGEVTLQLEENQKLSTAVFELAVFSNSAVSDALNGGKPIEILQ